MAAVGVPRTLPHHQSTAGREVLPVRLAHRHRGQELPDPDRLGERLIEPQRTGGIDDPGYVLLHSFEPGLPSFNLEGVINGLGIRLFGPDFIGRTEGAAARRALLLQTLRQHRMLLIWDNFESVFSLSEPGAATPPLSAAQRAEIVAFLAAFRAEGFASAVILTSRMPKRSGWGMCAGWRWAGWRRRRRRSTPTICSPATRGRRRNAGRRRSAN